jgi:hypothetical protein
MPLHRNFLLIIALPFLLSSCYTWKQFERDMGADVVGSKEKGKKYFIETKSGQTYDVASSTFKSGWQSKNVQTADNNQVSSSDIVAYQDEAGYHRKVGGGFVPRIISGKINVYKSSQSVSYQTRDVTPMAGGGNRITTRNYRGYKPLYLIQKGNGGTEELSGDGVRDMVKDNAASMEIMNEYYRVEKSVKMWKIINTSATVGGIVVAAAAGKDANDEVSAVGYGSVALFAAGITSGFFTRNRKARNPIKLFDAIHIYNKK